MTKLDFCKDIIKLLRLPQLIAVAVVQLSIHYFFFAPAMNYYGGEAKMSALPISLCVLATVLTALSGFLANDYFDTRIDKVNRPLTRIVDVSIDRGMCFNLCMGVTFAALILAGILAYLAHNSTYFFIFAGVIGILWFYSASYKRAIVLGNFMFGLSFAMIPLTIILFDVWFANLTYGAYPKADFIFNKLLSQGLTISSFALGYMFIYDIVRGMEEEKGERELECRSLCIVCGRKVTKAIIVSLSVILGLALAWCCVTTMNYTGQTGIYFACFIISLTIALSVQIFKSVVRFDFMIVYSLIYLILATGLVYLSIYSYYLE